MPNEIYITLDGYDGELDARALLNAGYLFLGLLHDLDIAVSSDTRGSLTWEISTLSKSSPAQLGFVGRAKRGTGQDRSPEIESRCIRGMSLLAERAERDPYYSDQALYKAYGLARLRQRHLFSRIVIHTRNEEVSVEPSIVQNVDDLTKEIEESEGSIVGNLDSISVHKGNEFRVWNEINGKAVTCRFPNSLLSAAKEHLKQRVLVYGTLRRNGLGEIGSIVVGGIEAYPSDEHLPTIEEMSGSIPNISGGLPLREYMKLLRDE
jgi:hypothetical protein